MSREKELGKNYKMKEVYNSNNLGVGRLASVEPDPYDPSPVIRETEQKYIFERLVKGKEVKYKEVFTGFEAVDEAEYFNLPYIRDIKPLKEVNDVIPRLGMLLILDEINFKKEDN